jgi:Na+/H+ antiporter
VIKKSSDFIKWFIKQETAAGITLLIMTVVALLISNSFLADQYFSILKYYVSLGFGSFALKLSVMHWINDALMAVFFYL